MTTPLDVHVFVDPMDPRGWGSEPAHRWLRAAVPDADWHYHPTVLAADWATYDGPEFPDGRETVPAVCARVSEASGMPIDEFLWFDDAPTTSVHACRAVHAVVDEDPTVGRRFLRAAREATFIHRTNLDSPDAIETLAERVDGVDADAIVSRSDGGGDPSSRVLGAGPSFDPVSVQGVRVANERPELPTVIVEGPDGRQGQSGRIDVPQLERIIGAVTGDEPADPELDVQEAIEAFSDEGWLAVAEIAALTGAGYDDVVAAARTEDEIVERTFAAESFYRTTAQVSDTPAAESAVESSP